MKHKDYPLEKVPPEFWLDQLIFLGRGIRFPEVNDNYLMRPERFLVSEEEKDSPEDRKRNTKESGRQCTETITTSARRARNSQEGAHESHNADRPA